MRPIIDRFWSKVSKSPEEADCWNWTAGTNGIGYGKLAISHGRYVYAHRFAFTLLVGPIPDGLVIDHTCKNRGCVNPKHLRAVTVAENNRHPTAYQRSGARTCRRGHAKYREPRGTWACRQCRRLWKKASITRYAKQKVATPVTA